MPRKFIKSFRYARAGAEHVLKTQRNIWIHIFIGLAVLAVAVWLRISLVEMAILALTISLVVAIETVNTAIEELVNILSPGHQLEAKLAKDIAAAAVLLAAVGAVLVGLLVFLPKLIGRI